MNAAKEVIDTVNRLLASDVSAYQIDRECNIPRSATTRLRSGERDLNNLRWYTIEAYYNYAKKHNI